VPACRLRGEAFSGSSRVSQETRAMSGHIEDPFLKTFLDRVPKEVASTFTAAQLDAVRRAFGARSPGAHTVDLRFSVPLGLRWFYVVFLVGRERRTINRQTLERLFRPILTFANVAVLSIFLLMFSGAVFSLGYLGKRALGIDVFPGIDMLPDRMLESVLK
jgi:hypothetical protein